MTTDMDQDYHIFQSKFSIQLDIGIVECYALTKERTSEEMGLDDVYGWLPHAFDLDSITDIRIFVAGPDHEDIKQMTGMSLIYTNGGEISVNVPYRTMVEAWKAWRQKIMSPLFMN